MTQENAVVTREVDVQVSPDEVVELATAQAKLLMRIVEQTKCYQEISGKRYLQVEAWETIGAFNRTHAETEGITPILKDDKTIGYQSHVQLWKDGIVVGGAIMPCYFTENCCRGKEGDAKHKASMSAAQTFATSKAYRMNFSYVAILAGFQPLPAEEITEDMRGETDKSQHWCKEHDTAFFKRGKMKFYAHPIEGTDPVKWCPEHTATKKAEEKTTEDASPELKVDMPWLIESVNKLKWDVLAHIKNTYAVSMEGSLIDVVSRLSIEQQKELGKEVEDRLSML